MHLDNYMVFNNVHGVYTYAFQSERKDNCLVCSRCTQELNFLFSDKLQCFIDTLSDETGFNLKTPTLTTLVGTSPRTLYMSNIPQMEEALRPNLDKTFRELELVNLQEVVVTDPGLKMPVHFIISLS